MTDRISSQPPCSMVARASLRNRKKGVRVDFSRTSARLRKIDSDPVSRPRSADYAGHVADKLSDRVKRFFTLNECAAFVELGQGRGVHAPAEMSS
jgi:hypothetical protein